MNKNYSHYLVVLALLVAPFIYLSTFYASLPATIPTHFNIKGEADGFGDKTMAFFGPVFIGIVSLFTYLIMINIKKIDPKRYENNNDAYFKAFGLIIVAFMSALNMVILTKTKYPGAAIDKLLLPLLGLLFAVMGFYFPKLSQNYFAGFKLPWTLSSEENWKATHMYAGKFWLYGGMLQMVLGFVLPDMWAFISFFVIMLPMVIAPIVFSYRFFKAGK
ncbi:MAG: hypothetical protein RL372_998 [Bacteroidota bacterium]|jgi:uncharacterized membrane protein